LEGKKLPESIYKRVRTTTSITGGQITRPNSAEKSRCGMKQSSEIFVEGNWFGC